MTFQHISPAYVGGAVAVDLRVLISLEDPCKIQGKAPGKVKDLPSHSIYLGPHGSLSLRRSCIDMACEKAPSRWVPGGITDSSHHRPGTYASGTFKQLQCRNPLEPKCHSVCRCAPIPVHRGAHLQSGMGCASFLKGILSVDVYPSTCIGVPICSQDAAGPAF